MNIYPLLLIVKLLKFNKIHICYISFIWKLFCGLLLLTSDGGNGFLIGGFALNERRRGCSQFDFAKEKRNSPQTPLPLFLFSNGTEAGGQKTCPELVEGFLPPSHKYFPAGKSRDPSSFARGELRPCEAPGIRFSPLPFCLPAWASPPKLFGGLTVGP